MTISQYTKITSRREVITLEICFFKMKVDLRKPGVAKYVEVIKMTNTLVEASSSKNLSSKL